MRPLSRRFKRVPSFGFPVDALNRAEHLYQENPSGTLWQSASVSELNQPFLDFESELVRDSYPDIKTIAPLCLHFLADCNLRESPAFQC